MANVVCEILWVVCLLTELGVKMSSFPIIWCDNTGDVPLTDNPIQHSKTKHVELDLCFVREKVQNVQVIFNFVLDPNQIANILTKPITEKIFMHFRKKKNSDLCHSWIFKTVMISILIDCILLHLVVYDLIQIVIIFYVLLLSVLFFCLNRF